MTMHANQTNVYNIKNDTQRDDPRHNQSTITRQTKKESITKQDALPLVNSNLNLPMSEEDYCLHHNVVR